MQEKVGLLSMNFQTDEDTAQGKMKKPPHAPTSFSTEAREGDGVYGVTGSLYRALVTIGRDSALRRKFLRQRWQGAMQGLSSSDKLHLVPEEIDFRIPWAAH